MKKDEEYYWECEICGKEFDTKRDCDKHEKTCVSNRKQRMAKNFLYIGILILFLVLIVVMSLNGIYIKETFMYELLGAFLLFYFIYRIGKKLTSGPTEEKKGTRINKRKSIENTTSLFIAFGALGVLASISLLYYGRIVVGTLGLAISSILEAIGFYGRKKYLGKSF